MACALLSHTAEHPVVGLFTWVSPEVGAVVEESPAPPGPPAAASSLGFERRMVEEHRVNYHARANDLADQCQMLRDEITKLLAENARLRRRLEK
jgi:hypothetical protein